MRNLKRSHSIIAVLAMCTFLGIPAMTRAADFEPFNPVGEATQSWWADPVGSQRLPGRQDGSGLFLAIPPDAARGSITAHGDPMPSGYMELGYSQPLGGGSWHFAGAHGRNQTVCLLYTSPSPRDA